jgi:S1-C subfamily serine protease
LLVQQVQPGTSADAAGLRGADQVVIIGNEQLGIGGDLLIAADGQPLDREDSLVKILARKRVGDALDLSVYRRGRNLRINVKLMRAPLDQ